MKKIIPLSLFLILSFAVPDFAESQVSSGEPPSPAGDSRSETPPKPPGPHHEITVTATRTPTAVSELGRSVTVLTHEEIAASGAVSVSELLERVPGFNVVQSGSFGGATSVFVRGGESDFNLVLIDGVQVNRPGGEFDFANLSTANIERIEIVRGPSSVLYGTEAVSSTIHIITRSGQPQARPAGVVRAEGGELGTYGLLGQIAGGSERFRYALGAAGTRTDGIFDFNSQYRRREASGRGVFQLGERSVLSSTFRYTTATQHYPTDDTGAVVDPNDYRDWQEGVYSAELRHHASSRFDTKLLYGYSRYRATSYTLEDDVTDFYTDIFRSNEDRHYLDWQNSIRLVPGHLLTGGASLKRESSVIESARRRSAGVYLQDQAGWGNRWFLTVGLRYDDNDRFSSFLTGQADLAVLLSDSFKLRGSVGNGFRAPAFSEIVGFPEYGILGNPSLRPEQNRAGEFGFDMMTRDGRWRATATAFFNQFRDLIEFTFTAPPGQPNYVNIEAANSRGIELEGSGALTPALRLGMNYTWTRTRVVDAGTAPFGNFEKGRPLLRRPAHLANLFGAFTRNLYSLRVDLFYKGRRDDRQFFPDFTSSRVTLPAYLRLDLSAAVPLVRSSDSGEVLSLILRGENVLNQDYTELAGFRSPGRRLTGGLEFRF